MRGALVGRKNLTWASQCARRVKPRVECQTSDGPPLRLRAQPSLPIRGSDPEIRCIVRFWRSLRRRKRRPKSPSTERYGGGPARRPIDWIRAATEKFDQEAIVPTTNPVHVGSAPIGGTVATILRSRCEPVRWPAQWRPGICRRKLWTDHRKWRHLAPASPITIGKIAA